MGDIQMRYDNWTKAKLEEEFKKIEKRYFELKERLDDMKDYQPWPSGNIVLDNPTSTTNSTLFYNSVKGTWDE
jgi:predicted nuclease with TOPRIM domain